MSPRRYAVLIGTDRFRTEDPGLPPLRCAVADAEGMAELLTSEVHGPYAVSVLKNALHLEVLQEIHRVLTQAQHDDIVLIYYSGHGKLDEHGDLYLTTYDTTIRELPICSLPATDLLKKHINRARSSKIVVILDCCYSGAVERAYKGSVSEQAQMLFQESRGRGAFILTACTDVQRAEEKEGDHYSVLTKHILVGIRDGGADVNDDGIVTIQELFDYVQEQVPKDNYAQRPQGFALRVENGQLAIALTGKVPRQQKRLQVRNAILKAAIEHHLPQDVLGNALLAIEENSPSAPDGPEDLLEGLHRLLQNEGEFINAVYRAASTTLSRSSKRPSSYPPYGWGFRELVIDDVALVQGELRIIQATGILQNGSDFELNSGEIPPRSIEQLANNEDTFEIALCSQDAHFCVGRAVTLVSDTSSLRLCQLTRGATGQYVVVPSYVPPCLDFAASEYLLMLLRRVVEFLSVRASSLSTTQRQKVSALAAPEFSMLANFWLLQTINTHLPELKHLWEKGRGHPEALYLAMLRLAGALSTFARDASASGLPTYQHENLGGCFTDVFDRISKMLEIVVPSNFQIFKMILVGRQIWAASMTSVALTPQTRIYIGVKATLDEEMLIRTFPLFAKISSPTNLETVVRKALGGITVRHIRVMPAAVPIKLGYTYFEVNQSGRLWDEIQRSSAVSVYIPAEIPDPSLELITITL